MMLIQKSSESEVESEWYVEYHSNILTCGKRRIFHRIRNWEFVEQEQMLRNDKKPG